ncbi:MAG: Ig-like domain-containing protein [Clostridia bacterium]|nr:Ig-like domain-containing protein [Clostridia bacterium]
MIDFLEDEYTEVFEDNMYVIGKKLNDITVQDSMLLNLGDEEYVGVCLDPEDTIETEVTYSSEDDTVASVDENGKVTAKKVGQTRIIVRVGEITKEVITVVVSKATGLTVDGKIELNVTDSYSLKAVVTPSSSTDKVTYESEDETIATVDEKGKIVAKKVGKTKINVTIGDIEKTVIVTVLPEEIVTEVITPEEIVSDVITAEISNEVAEVLSSSIETNEEVYEKVKEEILKGNSITTVIDIAIVEDEKQLEEVTKQIEEQLVNEKVVISNLLDINVLVKSNGENIGKLTELTNEIEFTIKIPNDLKKA